MKKKFILIIIIILISLLTIYIALPTKIKNVVFSEEINENNAKIMTIEFKNNNFFSTKCRINNGQWIKSKGNKCSFEVTSGNYEIEVKNLFSIVKTNEELIVNGVKNISLESKKIYLALNETLKLNSIIDTVGDADTSLKWKSSNKEVVSVEDGKITGLQVGESDITVYAKNNKSYSTKIIVTDLIVPRILNDKKKVIPCNKYTEEEAKLLDEILSSRVNMKGEGTRAALIEVIRFLTLSFEYKIPYFFENGRLENYLGQNYVDGEGRYYKKGLYLSDSKKDDILASYVGPSIWGCPLTNFDTSYGWGYRVKYPNGLDCSGFVTWAFLNAGIDVGDIGAGVSNGIKDVSDLGKMHDLTYEYVNKKEYKVGDIIARDGHTALIAGIDDEYIYIAESLLKGVRIEKFRYKVRSSQLYSLYSYINTLDEVYVSDGIYENMW